MGNLIHVAVGVIRACDGKVLLAKRRQDVHQGGLWEFPGGKVEEGESVENALRRELQEELAIEVLDCRPLIQVRHHYGDKSVLLDVREVLTFSGTPSGNEGQPLQWVAIGDLKPGDDCLYPLPAANAAIIKALRVPDALAITGEFADLADFEARLDRMLQAGIRFIQLRPTASIQRFSSAELQDLVRRVSQRCSANRAALVINSSWLGGANADFGIHLTSHALVHCKARPELAPGALLGASCHNEADLARAAELDVDYVVLSPVQATPTHPQAQAMGWSRFRELVETVNFPVYALGGLGMDEMERAKAEGGQGIAAIGAFWGR
ncbi:Nudix family hydrolase [Proteobacteria bacterium 005FR1]|nr:Nudix family hydrolase [Proteobacteria bacterium 005FR1]